MSPTACLTHKESQYSLLSPISGHKCLSFIQSITRSLICWCPLGLALCWVEKTHWLITLIPGPPHEAPWLEELSFSCCLTTRPLRGILILQFWPCHWAPQRSLNCLPLTPFLWPTMTFPCWGWRELWECDICSSTPHASPQGRQRRVPPRHYSQLCPCTASLHPYHSGSEWFMTLSYRWNRTRPAVAASKWQSRDSNPDRQTSGSGCSNPKLRRSPAQSLPPEARF